MIVALYILLALVAVGIVLYLLDRRSRHAEEPVAEERVSDTAPEQEEECCGMHITCERDSLLAGMSDEVEYFDDEELDIFKGRGADDYTDAEIEQFRDVLLTLLPDDIAPWARSIQLRGIELPVVVREELLMIVAEERSKRNVSANASTI